MLLTRVLFLAMLVCSSNICDGRAYLIIYYSCWLGCLRICLDIRDWCAYPLSTLEKYIYHILLLFRIRI